MAKNINARSKFLKIASGVGSDLAKTLGLIVGILFLGIFNEYSLEKKNDEYSKID